MEQAKLTQDAIYYLEIFSKGPRTELGSLARKQVIEKFGLPSAQGIWKIIERNSEFADRCNASSSNYPGDEEIMAIASILKPETCEYLYTQYQENGSLTRIDVITAFNKYETTL